MGKNPTSIDDEEIFDIVTDLNRRPYIQTIYCCSGHLLWETGKGDNPPYVEYSVTDQEGYDLTKRVEEQIKKELPLVKPRLIPHVAYFRDSSLRFSGIYEGEYDDRVKIITAVRHFWNSFRRGLQD